MKIENSITDIQKIVNNWIFEHGGYWPPLSMISAIIEELGEVAKEINSLEGYKTKKAKKSNSNLGEELSDLLFSIICVANFYKIDLGEEIFKTIEKYTIRDSNPDAVLPTEIYDNVILLGKTQADAICGAKKRDEQQQVDEQQPQRLAQVPDHFEGIER